MLSTDDLIEIDGWERDHYGDYICEWKRELDEDEIDQEWSAFVLTVQEQEDDEYYASIAVAFPGGGGDLLSADYSETCRTLEEAQAAGVEFVEEVEEEYLNE